MSTYCDELAKERYLRNKSTWKHTAQYSIYLMKYFIFFNAKYKTEFLMLNYL